MADEEEIFAPTLLWNASAELGSKPEQPAVDQATQLMTEARPAAFGQLPSGQAAADVVRGWVAVTLAELGRVGIDVADLSAASGDAGDMAAGVGPAMRDIASAATPRSAEEQAAAESAAADEIGTPEANRTGDVDG
jgi:hypothetical protein